MPQSSEKIVLMALNGFFKKKITIRKEPQNLSVDKLGCIINDRMPTGSAIQIDTTLNPFESSSFRCTPPTHVIDKLSSFSINKSTSKSMPNIRIFEYMKKSVYPSLHTGDIDCPEISRKNTQKLSVQFLEFKKKLNDSILMENEIIVPLTKESQVADDYPDERRITKGNSASLKLTVKVSQSSYYTLRHTGFLTQRYRNSRSSVLDKIDTIVDVESMLMKNEDFVRYLKEQRPQIPRVEFHATSSKCLRNKPKVIKKQDLPSFGHRKLIENQVA